ncbi:MAG: hypothetical protein ACRC6M_00710 [Microcystaceae cyanobacterium]
MFSLDSHQSLLNQAQVYLDQLSEDKLKVAVDFLGYLQQKEEWEATEELLNIPGFEQELLEAEEELKRGDVVCFF